MSRYQSLEAPEGEDETLEPGSYATVDGYMEVQGEQVDTLLETECGGGESSAFVDDQRLDDDDRTIYYALQSSLSGVPWTLHLAFDVL